jgi:hypothetical protein
MRINERNKTVKDHTEKKKTQARSREIKKQPR